MQLTAQYCIGQPNFVQDSVYNISKHKIIKEEVNTAYP